MIQFLRLAMCMIHMYAMIIPFRNVTHMHAILSCWIRFLKAGTERSANVPFPFRVLVTPSGPCIHGCV